MSLKCYFRYPDGHYCNCWAKKGSRFCGNHQTPCFATTSHKRMHPHARLATPDDVMQLVRESLNAVRFGSMTPGQAVAINRLVESWLKLFARSCAYNREAALRTEILPSLIDADAAAEAERAKTKLPTPFHPNDPEPLEFDAAGQPDPDAEPLPTQPSSAYPQAYASAPTAQQPLPSPPAPASTDASAVDPYADYGPVEPNLEIRRWMDSMCAPPLPTTPDPPDSQPQPDPDPDHATVTATAADADVQPLRSHPEAPASTSTPVSQPSSSAPPSHSQPEARASGSIADSDEAFERILDSLAATLRAPRDRAAQPAPPASNLPLKRALFEALWGGEAPRTHPTDSTEERRPAKSRPNGRPRDK